MSASVAPLRLAFFGPQGTFTEAAALRYAVDMHLSAVLSAAASIPATTAMVVGGEADEAVVPVENSLEGSVNETLDLLIHTLQLKIRHEIVLPVNHCLIVPPGTDQSAIRVVYSHPQALAQCRQYLEREWPGVEAAAALSTAAAVQRAMGESGAAALAPRRAAEIHGGVVLAEGVQDDARNSTRFIVLAAEDAPPSGDDKTSIAFSVDDRPGALVRIMQQFADAGINLTKIESRPARSTLGVYVFLLDCQGHRLDTALAKVLGQVQQEAAWLKVLGSYPYFRTIPA